MKIFLGILTATLAIQYLFHIPLIAGHYLFGMLFGTLLFFLAKNPIKLLVNPVTTYIGKISYSMYLSHVAILWILGNLGVVDIFGQFPLINFFYKFFLLLITSIGFSSFLFFTVERPGQLLGKWIIDRRERRKTLDINTTTRTW